MIFYRCNRCKAEADKPRVQKNDPPAPPKGWEAVMLPLRMRSAERGMVWDLCPECLAGLEAWLTTRPAPEPSEPQETVKCPACRAPYPRSEIEQHVRRSHPAPVPLASPNSVECPLCSKAYSETRIEKHVQRVHRVPGAPGCTATAAHPDGGADLRCCLDATHARLYRATDPTPEDHLAFIPSSLPDNPVQGYHRWPATTPPEAS